MTAAVLVGGCRPEDGHRADADPGRPRAGAAPGDAPPPFTLVDDSGDRLFPPPPGRTGHELFGEPAYVYAMASWCPYSREFAEQDLIPVANAFGGGTDRPLFLAVYGRDEWAGYEAMLLDAAEKARPVGDGDGLESARESVRREIAELRRRAEAFDADLGKRFVDPRWIAGHILRSKVYLCAFETGGQPSSDKRPRAFPQYFDPEANGWLSHEQSPAKAMANALRHVSERRTREAVSEAVRGKLPPLQGEQKRPHHPPLLFPREQETFPVIKRPSSPVVRPSRPRSRPSKAPVGAPSPPL